MSNRIRLDDRCGTGKTTYIKSNFDHERIALSYFDNDRKKEMEYIEKCLSQGKNSG
ncbi:MAG: hypothetical protein OEL81_04165 [Nitrosopumilus sp.]|nr:hypothetical protein [Nitrosopumilus sp.]